MPAQVEDCYESVLTLLRYKLQFPEKAIGYSKMVGIHLSRVKDHEETIRTWMDTVAKNGGIDRYDDIHVDQIDANWKARSLWVSAALESFEHAARIRDAEKSDLSVVLAFSLDSDDNARGIDFKNLEELEKEFHVTPPSLYLFRVGTEFWTQAAEYVDVRDVDWVPIFGINKLIKRCVFMEFRRSNSDEYTRSLFVSG